MTQCKLARKLQSLIADSPASPVFCHGGSTIGGTTRETRSSRGVLRVAIVCLALIGEVGAADTVKMRFEIQPSDAAQALTEFARQADVQLLFPYELVSGIRLNGVSGEFTVDEALIKLLAGTCLQVEFSDGRDIKLRLGQNRGFWYMKKNSCRQGRFRSVLYAGLVGTSSMTATNAQPATEPSTSVALEEVVVTARKRAENLQEVPVSIVAFSDQLIERQGIDNLRDIGALVPNLNLSSRTDGFPNVTIRGVGGFGNTQGVGFYLDDVQLFSDATSRFGDLERIEVIKGPQGTLYGGSNIGGAIKFVAKRPDSTDFSGSLQAKLGQRGLREIEGSVNTPIGESGWALRAFAFMADDDGYITNLNPPRLNGVRGTNDPNIGYSEEVGGRIALSGDLTESLSLYASVRWNSLEGSGNTWIREVSDEFQYERIANYSANPTIDRETAAGSVELTWDFGRASLLSLTSYTDTESTRYNDVDAREEFIIESNQPQKMQVFTQELRLTSQNDGPFNWIAGAYYSLFEEQMNAFTSWFDARVDGDGNISGPLGCAIGMPTCSGLWAGEIPTPAQEADRLDLPFEIRDRDKSHLAFFANANYKLDQWELDVGVRADTWKNRTNNIDLGIVSEVDDLELMPRVSVARKIGDDAMLYATYSKGFEPGGFNMTTFAGESELAGFGIEEATSFELGLKSEFLDRRLLLNSAVFFIEYDARQVEYQVQRNNVIVEGIFNLGDSRQYGIEADLQFRATPSLSLSANAGWINAEWVNGTSVDLLTSIVDISGRDVPNVNDFSWHLAADYDRQIAASGLRLIGGVQISRNGAFQGLQVWNPVLNPAYTVVNAQVGLRGRNWELLVRLDNVTDEEYFTDVQRFPNLYAIDGLESVNIGTLAPPRLLSASIKYMF